MVSDILVSIGSGNGLLPNGTKALPEPMLTYHWWASVAFYREQFHWYCLRCEIHKRSENCTLKTAPIAPSVNELIGWNYMSSLEDLKKSWKLNILILFSNVMLCLFIKFVLLCMSRIFGQHWFGLWLDAPATSHYLCQYWLWLMLPYVVSLGHNELTH